MEDDNFKMGDYKKVEAYGRELKKQQIKGSLL